MPAVFAVHDNVPTGSQIFELGDGATPTRTGSADILGSAAQPGPDWADIFNATGGVANLAGGITAVFLKDDTSQSSATDRTVFSATSEKNNDAIPTWSWDAGNVPAKDDLVNAYAYSKINPNNSHVIVYVGIERLDPSGDSHIDIELFQDDVTLDEAVPCNDPGADSVPCAFEGTRTHHDVLVSMDYTRGGGLGSLVVHLWNATNGEYDEIETVIGEGCNGVAAASLTSDSICAFNNGASIDGGPWPNYDRHGAVITQIAANGFTEFGLDLTEAGGGETPCISTILGKSRSSQSFTAELKDFAGPFPFDLCSAGIRIEPSAVNPVGAPHTFNVTVTQNVAGVSSPAENGTVVDVTLTDSAGAVSVVSSETCSTGTVNGTCSVTFTSYTPGNVTGHASADVDIGGTIIHVETDGTGSNSGDALKQFVGRPIVKLTGFGYTNAPTDNPPTRGVVNGTTTYTVKLRNYGDANATQTTWLNVSAPGGAATGAVVFVNATGGTTSQPVANASCVTSCSVVSAGKTIAVGSEVTYTVSIHYQGVPDGTVIRAALAASYTVAGSSPRTPSGVPATIDFTVQSD